MNGYTKRAIGEVLNNAVAFTQNPASSKHPLLEKRKNRLIDYTRALIQPAIDHLEEEVLTAEELVFAFCVAALWVHNFRILKTDKLPMLETTEKFFNKTVETGIPSLQVSCTKCGNKFEV